MKLCIKNLKRTSTDSRYKIRHDYTKVCPYKQSQRSGPSSGKVYEEIGGSQNGSNRPTGMPFIGTLGRPDNVTQ